MMLMLWPFAVTASALLRFPPHLLFQEQMGWGSDTRGWHYWVTLHRVSDNSGWHMSHLGPCQFLLWKFTMLCHQLIVGSKKTNWSDLWILLRWEQRPWWSAVLLVKPNLEWLFTSNRYWANWTLRSDILSGNQAEIWMNFKLETV